MNVVILLDCDLPLIALATPALKLAIASLLPFDIKFSKIISISSALLANTFVPSAKLSRESIILFHLALACAKSGDVLSIISLRFFSKLLATSPSVPSPPLYNLFALSNKIPLISSAVLRSISCVIVKTPSLTSNGVSLPKPVINDLSLPLNIGCFCNISSIAKLRLLLLKLENCS